MPVELGEPREAIRSVALIHENALFAGCDESGDNSPVAGVLIVTCKSSDINPQVLLTRPSPRRGTPGQESAEIVP